MHDLNTIKTRNQDFVLQKAKDAGLPFTLKDFDMIDISQGNLHVLNNLPVITRQQDSPGFLYQDVIAVVPANRTVASMIYDKVKKGYAYAIRKYKKYTEVLEYLPA